MRPWVQSALFSCGASEPIELKGKIHSCAPMPPSASAGGAVVARGYKRRHNGYKRLHCGGPAGDRIQKDHQKTSENNILTAGPVRNNKSQQKTTEDNRRQQKSTFRPFAPDADPCKPAMLLVVEHKGLSDSGVRNRTQGVDGERDWLSDDSCALSDRCPTVFQR